MEKSLDYLEEPAINLVYIIYAILEYDTPFSGVKVHFILHSIHK